MSMQARSKDLVYGELAYQIVGAAMAVHRQLGPGFLESVYQKALAHELQLRQITFERLVPLDVQYKAILVGKFEADFVVEQKIVLEIKAIKVFHSRHTAQALNYLAATKLKLALLINFGAESLQHKRVIR